MAPSTDAYAAFSEHRTHGLLHALLHYGHVIPVTHGYTRRYVDEHYPGWTRNELVGICRAAGIVVTPDKGAPLRCHPGVVALHFDRSGAFQVEWVASQR